MTCCLRTLMSVENRIDCSAFLVNLVVGEFATFFQCLIYINKKALMLNH